MRGVQVIPSCSAEHCLQRAADRRNRSKHLCVTQHQTNCRFCLNLSRTELSLTEAKLTSPECLNLLAAELFDGTVHVSCRRVTRTWFEPGLGDTAEISIRICVSYRLISITITLYNVTFTHLATVSPFTPHLSFLFWSGYEVRWKTWNCSWVEKETPIYTFQSKVRDYFVSWFLLSINGLKLLFWRWILASSVSFSWKILTYFPKLLIISS